VILAGAGDDTITLGDGLDILVWGDKSNATEHGHDTVTGFDTANDKLVFSTASIEELSSVGAHVAGDGSDVAAGAVTLLKVDTKATDIGAAANSVITIDGNYATTDDLTKALETGGDMELIFGALDTANDSILIAYDDGADTHVGMLTTSAAISDGNKAASDTLSFTELVTLTGVADATSLTVTDFGDFIA